MICSSRLFQKALQNVEIPVISSRFFFPQIPPTARLGFLTGGGMGGNATELPILERRRHSSPRYLPRRHGPQEMASLPIPDELLPEIFLRLSTTCDLVRASAACVSFRRVVADRSFLRRYRKLHAPPLLGFLDFRRVFHPAEPPHPSASAAKAVALAADFTMSFLPAPASDWTISDIRGGLVLLDRRDCAELVVCDPLHRRHLLLPPMPEFDEWVRSVDKPRRFGCHILLVGGDEEASEEAFFRVIYVAFTRHKEAVFVFSSSTGQWRATPSIPQLPSSRWHQYVYGCLYGVTGCGEKIQVLDTRSMEFSHMDLPPEARAGGSSHVHIAFVEAGEGTIGMFVLPDQTSDLSYFVRPNNGGSSSHWQLEKTISLDSSQYSFPESSAGTNLFLHHSGSPSPDAGLFSMDVKTFQLERVFGSHYNMLYPWAYNNFPPWLSTPAISSGTREGKEMLEQGAKTLQAEEAMGSPHDERTDNDADVGDQASVSRTGDGAD